MSCNEDKQKAHKQLSRVLYWFYMSPPPPFLFSLPSGHLQVIPGGRIMSAMSAQQSLHHRGRHPVWLSERLLPRRHGQTGGHVHEWVSLFLSDKYKTQKYINLKVACNHATGQLWHNLRQIFGLELPFADILQHISGWHPISHHWIKGQYLLWCIIPAPNFMHLIQRECAAMLPSLFGDLGSSK